MISGNEICKHSRGGEIGLELRCPLAQGRLGMDPGTFYGPPPGHKMRKSKSRPSSRAVYIERAESRPAGKRAADVGEGMTGCGWREPRAEAGLRVGTWSSCSKELGSIWALESGLRIVLARSWGGGAGVRGQCSGHSQEGVRITKG